MPIEKFKSDMTPAKMLEASIDEKPVYVKYEYLLRRYKSYHNFTLYLSSHLKVGVRLNKFRMKMKKENI